MSKIGKSVIKLGAATVVAISLTALNGCSSYRAMYKKADNQSQALAKEIAEVRAQEQKGRSVIINKEGMYSSNKALPVQKLPVWAHSRVNLHAEGLPLHLLVDRVLEDSNAYANFERGSGGNQPITMHYNGTIKGALDKLAAKSGLAYKIDGDQVQWCEFLTKTFNISFMPGESKYFLGKKEGTSSGTSNQLSGESVTGQSGEQDQYSNLQGSVSVWKDLNQTINSLLSKDGKAIVSEATTSVTVHDHVKNVKAIDGYLKQLNKTLTTQVAIKVRVLQINLNENFNLGIDWNLVRSQLGQKFSLTGDFSSAISSSATGGLNFIGESGRLLGSKVLLNALSQQGKISVVTEPQVVTMNNQVSQISITNQQAYLAKVETTVAPGSNTTQTSLTPGQVTTGFSLYLLPKIHDNNIYLQITSGLSNLVNITEQKSSDDSKTASKIQTPIIDEKRFNQRTAVPSGSTLILAGFKQVKSRNVGSSMFGLKPLGGHGADNNTSEIIVLITPTIVRNQY